MDRTAFWHYLTFIVTPAPLTMFRGIFKMPAGHRVTIDCARRARRATQWWDCRPDASRLLTEQDLSEPEAVAELTRLLKQSIARRMVSDVPFGVLLSGGVDSSLNVALMSELMTRPVTTFTIGYEGKEDYNEFQFARRVSRALPDRSSRDADQSAKRRRISCRCSSGCRTSRSPTTSASRSTSSSRLVKQSGTTVVQVGEGADENFLGYWWCEHYRQKYESVYRPARNGAARLAALPAGAQGADAGR